MGTMRFEGPEPVNDDHRAQHTGAASPLGEHAVLSLITLHLARCPAFPEGNPRTGYTFVAPLDSSGHLDAQSWTEQRDRCAVQRFRDGDTDRIGHLVHRRGGAGGATWHFVYDDGRPHDEESGHRLQDHRFIAGDYVSIAEDDGEVNTYQIADVRAARV